MTPMLDPTTGGCRSRQGDLTGTFKPPKQSPEDALIDGGRSRSGRARFSGDLPKTPPNVYENLPNSPESLPTTQRSKAPYSPSSIQAKTQPILDFSPSKPSAFNPYLYPQDLLEIYL